MSQTPPPLPAPHLPPDTKLQLRFYLGEALMFGPGKARLMEGITQTGSIAAAGRAMGMSYKRAWSLVEAMNAAFPSPLVSSARGGQGGGGAQLTTLGAEVLQRYRAMEAASMAAAAPHLQALEAIRAEALPSKQGETDMSEGK